MAVTSTCLTFSGSSSALGSLTAWLRLFMKTVVRDTAPSLYMHIGCTYSRISLCICQWHIHSQPLRNPSPSQYGVSIDPSPCFHTMTAKRRRQDPGFKQMCYLKQKGLHAITEPFFLTCITAGFSLIMGIDSH
jgi:hypothetical protein